MKVKFGLKNVNVFPLTETTSEQTGAVTMSYGTGIKVPGAVNLTLNVDESEPEKFYADDGVYYVPAGASSGYKGNLEVAVIPDEVKLALMAFIKDASGVIVELAEAITKQFGMTFEISTDEKARRLIYYKCQFGRPSLATATNKDTKTPQTDTAPITVLPTSQLFNLGGEERAVISGYTNAETDSTVYNNWHTTPHLPSATRAPGQDEEDQDEENQDEENQVQGEG